MSHYELIQMAKGLGLEVDTISFYNEALRTKMHVIRFTTKGRFVPGKGYQLGDNIAKFSYHPDMEPMEYQDACGTLYNTLKQFESWR